jgi:hypothetical protein
MPTADTFPPIGTVDRRRERHLAAHALKHESGARLPVSARSGFDGSARSTFTDSAPSSRANARR